MEKVMDEIMALCVSYHHMFSTEQLVRNADDDKTRKALYAIYVKNKDIFESQYNTVQKLINE